MSTSKEPPLHPLFCLLPLSSSSSQSLDLLASGEFHALLTSPLAKSITHSSNENIHSVSEWLASISSALKSTSSDSEVELEAICIGFAALSAFWQGNVTGPVLPFKSENVLPRGLRRGGRYGGKEGSEGGKGRDVRRDMVKYLSFDAEACYELVDHIELFVLAREVLLSVVTRGLTTGEVVGSTGENTRRQAALRWIRLTVNAWHAKLLTSQSEELGREMTNDISALRSEILQGDYDARTRVTFLLESAAMKLYLGQDKSAMEDLKLAKEESHFEYVCTGVLGKRTQFQVDEKSQLVVLARSHSAEVENGEGTAGEKDAPETVDLNDDTLLERIAFSTTPEDALRQIPASLKTLNPNAQPRLHPLDSITLLLHASYLLNTSPADDLAREQIVPYAARVLDGGSSNWQIYTQALLVRSRIDAHRTRTSTRGLLQMIALSEQIAADTSHSDTDLQREESEEHRVTSTLPKPKKGESASVQERIQYISTLSAPYKWAIEVELAQFSVNMGSLVRAAEIYERLEYWAEAARCLVGARQERRARRIVRRQLFVTSEDDARDEEDERDGENAVKDKKEVDKEKDQLPADAPRLFCVLGEIDSNPTYYDRAWTVSNHRFARAKQLLGRHYMSSSINDLPSAEAAFSEALRILPSSTETWELLGIVRLRLEHWQGAADAFSRFLKDIPDHAGAWSNLASALLMIPPAEYTSVTDGLVTADEDEEIDTKPTNGEEKSYDRDAFTIFKQAAKYSRDDARFWDNVITVGVRVTPLPYVDLILAQRRVIDLRKKTEGESCVVAPLLEFMFSELLKSQSEPTVLEKQHGPMKMFTRLVLDEVNPLVTSSIRLKRLVAKVATYSRQYKSAVKAYEWTWNHAVQNPGWMGGDVDSAAPWNEVVKATEELVDAYTSLGLKNDTEGLAAGTDALVVPDWRFKCRSALRKVISSRTKNAFGDIDDEGLQRMKTRMEDFKL